MPTWDLLVGMLCDRYHKLPEEIESADMPRLLRMVEQVELFGVFKKLIDREKLTPSEHKMAGEFLQYELDLKK